jgi:23S rRNA pseudouridine2605 synthase
VPERLQKILARAGFASRRGAEDLIRHGRVTLNGETVSELGVRADASSDDVRVDGVRVRAPDKPVYLLLNKPKGVVTTRRDPKGRQTVMDLVPHVTGLFPVGRLDITSEGLLLLTNDGDFAERVMHPRYEVPRRYHAKVRGMPERRTLERLKRGVVVDGERLVVDRVRVTEPGGNAWLELELHEGKNKEVRRILAAVGHPVSKLRRVAIGPLGNEGLEPGHFRELTPREVSQLLRPRSAAATAGSGRPRRPSGAPAPGQRRRAR